MVKKSVLLTTDLSAFLQQEYETTFKRYYQTFEEFEKKWENDAVICEICKTWRWRGNSKRCDCKYQEYLKMRNNHDTYT